MLVLNYFYSTAPNSTQENKKFVVVPNFPAYPLLQRALQLLPLLIVSAIIEPIGQFTAINQGP